MILHTGGRAIGATSTRSSPASRARRCASAVGVGPTLLSCSSIRKTGEIMICSLWRKFVEIVSSPDKTRHYPARARYNAIRTIPTRISEPFEEKGRNAGRTSPKQRFISIDYMIEQAEDNDPRMDQRI